MTPIPGTSLLTKKSDSSNASNALQASPQFDQGFEGLTTPSMGAPFDNFIEPQSPVLSSDDLQGAKPLALPDGNFIKASETDGAVEVKREASSGTSANGQAVSQRSTNGEAVEDDLDATAIFLALESRERPVDASATDSFLSSYWPYLLMAIALIGWGFTQFLLKRAPSFKHHEILPKTVKPGSQTPGQFKVSQRFQKAKIDQAQVDSEPDLTGNELPRSTKINSTKVDHPTDDEFNLEADGNISDSDIINPQEASEIANAANASRMKARKPRFKTKIDKNSISKDKV